MVKQNTSADTDGTQEKHPVKDKLQKGSKQSKSAKYQSDKQSNLEEMSVTEEKIQELNSKFLEFMSKKEHVEAATAELYEDLLDEVLMGFVFDVHRTTKSGSSDVEEGIPDEESYVIIG